MKNIYKLFPFLIAVLMFNCEQDDSSTSLSNFVGFEIGPNNYELVKDGTETLEIEVAASEVSGSDRTYTILVDETSELLVAYTVPSTVTIPANSNIGILSITVTDDDNLAFVNQKLVLRFQNEAGLYFGDPITLNFIEQCLDTKVRLSITLDDYPEETSWELYDLSDSPVVIESGGPLATATPGSTVFVDFCLASGDYGIVVYDSYGDGIAGGGYTITSGDTTLASGQVGGSSGSSEFTVD